MVVLLRMTSVVSHFFGYNITGTFIYVILLVWHFIVQHECCVIVGVTQLILQYFFRAVVIL